MDTLDKVELIASILHITRFFKSGIPIYISEVSNTAGRKTRRRRKRRTKAIAERFAFDASEKMWTVFL